VYPVYLEYPNLVYPVLLEWILTFFSKGSLHIHTSMNNISKARNIQLGLSGQPFTHTHKFTPHKILPHQMHHGRLLCPTAHTRHPVSVARQYSRSADVVGLAICDARGPSFPVYTSLPSHLTTPQHHPTPTNLAVTPGLASPLAIPLLCYY